MKIELTADGSATLRSPIYGDTYHSVRGAVGESRHVFIEHGFNSTTGPIRILEMGFGTGLNAWLTLLEAEAAGRAVEYTAVELHPVPVDIADKLGYTDDERFAALHTAPWLIWPTGRPRHTATPTRWGVSRTGSYLRSENTQPAVGVPFTCVDANGGFRLRKIAGAMGEVLAESKLFCNFDLVYWDAFAPETQPELWTVEIFSRLFEAAAPGGVLVTYSAKGDVRRALRAAGFEVERLPGALGKRHMLRAAKH